jgi:hypothetical protein
MNFDWLAAWWDQIRRKAPSDPWNDDPEVRRVRERQHREGITDAVTAYRAREWRRRWIDAQSQAWQRDEH